jgi:hypothetical protein
MNRLERVLLDDMARLMDRLAMSTPEGTLEQIGSALPTLRARLDGMGTDLAAARASLVEGYARWTQALDGLENLWALAAWRSAVQEREQEVPQRAA